MRTFIIDYTNTENMLPDGDVIGYYGEHNATQLVITPPQEMTDCENISYYRIAFGLTNCRAVHSESLEKGETVAMPLFSQITKSDTVSVQLEGYSSDGNLVAKSETVKKLKFSESVGGVEISADSKSGGLAAEVAEIVEDVSNIKSQIEDLNDDISEINRPTNSIIFPLGNIDVDPPNFYVTYLNQGVWGLVDGSETFAEGIEIKTIEFLYLDNWIDIRDMIKLDYVPYTLNMYKTFFYSGEMILAVISCSSDNTIINAVNDFAIPSMRVTYYIP